MVTACALFGATGSVAYAADTAEPACETGKPMNITAKHYYLDNVLLEAGFIFDSSVATSTAPSLKRWRLKTARSSPCAITLATPTRLCLTDAGKKLMLPAMRDMHIHLIKPSTAVRGAP